MLYIECHKRVPTNLIYKFDHKFDFVPGDDLLARAKELAQNEVTNKTDLYYRFCVVTSAFFQYICDRLDLCDIPDLMQAYNDVETEIVNAVLTDMIHLYFINPNLVRAFISVFFSGDSSRLNDYESISVDLYNGVFCTIRDLVGHLVIDRFDEICTDPDDRARVFCDE